MSRKGRPPSLSPEDEALWRQVTETVTPRAPRPPGEAAPEAAKESPRPETGRQSRPVVRRQPPSPPRPPALAPVDRRLMRRIARGQAGADAVLDLHGLTRREAHARLLGFLTQSRAAGRRLVLVVTGKGREDEAGAWWEEGARGVLRRAVRDWLRTPAFRVHIVGFEAAPARRGGEGALFVQLRRPADTGAAR